MGISEIVEDGDADRESVRSCTASLGPSSCLSSRTDKLSTHVIQSYDKTWHESTTKSKLSPTKKLHSNRCTFIHTTLRIYHR